MTRSIVIGIDASNIRAGGGLTHLSQLLESFLSVDCGIKHIIVWGSYITLRKLPDNRKIVKIHVAMLDKSLPLRMLWQQFFLPISLKKFCCDALFSPGGTLPLINKLPSIVMSQNMLPFESKEAARFGGVTNFMRIKMWLLNKCQKRSMEIADGLVFLTSYAKKTVLPALCISNKNIAIIPHGIEERFFLEPRPMFPENYYSMERPFRLLYVSIVDVYKHQWHVAEAIATLREKGIPISIEFIGPSYQPALKRLLNKIKTKDPNGDYLIYRGAISFAELHNAYQNADAFVFASSCENLPNILLEAMAAGLPIACSRLGPMPEVLGRAGVYFDPEHPPEIEAAIHSLYKDPIMRRLMAWDAFYKAKNFSWRRCAKETFTFIVETKKKINTISQT